MTIQTEKGVGPMKMKNIVAMTMAATMVWNVQRFLEQPV